VKFHNKLKANDQLFTMENKVICRRYKMSQIIHYRYRILALVVLILILSTAAFGFAASNTVPAGQAGEGQGGITGYTVSSVVYTLDSSDPTAFDSVAFTLDAAASDVYAGLDDGVTIDWASCTSQNPPTDTQFSCDLTAVTVTVAGADALHVSSVE
jgi:hypothetical protein